MIELRQLSVDDGMDIYEMLQEMPKEENGLMNNANGLSFEQFKIWLKGKQAEAEQQGIVDGWKVPSTTYWLYVDGKPAGLGNLRHMLTEGLRKVGGNIGYGIRPSMRGHGYGKEFLRLLLGKAREYGIEKALITIHKDNAASIAVAKANGAVITDETDVRYLLWVDTDRGEK